MKKVIFDLMVSQPDLGSKFHGGGEYTKTVFRELCLNYSGSVNLSAFYDPDRFIDDWVLNLAKEHKVHLYTVHNYNDVSNLTAFQEADTFVACLMKGVDLVRRPKNMKVIGVYHGFRELEKPIDVYSPLYEPSFYRFIRTSLKLIFKKKYYDKKYRTHKKAIESCTDIVGVSNHSGYSAKVLFPQYDSQHIHVFYSPQKFVNKIDDLEKNSTEKQILMLGGDRWVKNIYRGILALDSLFSNNQLEGYSVRIVGGIPALIKRKIKNRNRFIALDYLSALELEKEYMSCDFFFYPTLNEGFGYPPQEAMKYGKTCVISAINSLTEVYGNSVYYCNPYDVEEMQCRLLQASEVKIQEKIIYKRYEEIAAKQICDLKALCMLISK